MILDNLENILQYKGISKNMDVAIDFLVDNDLRGFDTGKYEIDGDSVFYLIQEYDTKEINEGKFEGHRKYIDIQLILKGEEYIGYAPVSDLTPIGEYDVLKDKINFSGAEDLHCLKEKMFGIYFPHDGHKPSVHYRKTHVKKAVIKILV